MYEKMTARTTFAPGLGPSLAPSLTQFLSRNSVRGQQRTFTPPLRPCAFKIDHRHHLNLAWQRQEREAAALAPAQLQKDLTGSAVVPVRNLPHLEAVLNAAGGRLVILFCSSSSCGVCKEVSKAYAVLCADHRRALARTVFLVHDVNDEFDHPSDIARLYRIKSVPRFLFFIDGALMREAGMADVRRVGGSRAQVENAIGFEQHRLRAICWELLVKNAPSARR